MHTDVVVIGGGPGGATAAALIAAGGRSVKLFERSKEPAFKVGESLMPGTYWTFERLGVLDKLAKSAFPRKYSVQFFGASGRGSAPFYFNQANPHESAVTWQVLRSEFDQMLQDNATEKGAEVIRGASVVEVLFEGDRAIGVKVRMPDGSVETVSCKVVVDASGQSAFIARHLKIANNEPKLKKASVFTHFANGQRDEGIDEGATLILQTSDKNAWFWYIPLPDNRVSVGVVGDIDCLFENRSLDTQGIFDRELEKCETLQDRLKNAEQVLPMQTTKDFSYRASQVAGDGWVLVGDAYGFLDPVYSSGIFLALKSGEMAADAVLDGFGADDLSGERLGRFLEEFVGGMESIRKLIYAFYDKDFSFGKFLMQNPECQQGIVDILSGDVYTKDVTPIFEPMGEMCELPTKNF
ncbi:MAG TPA: NAD(P)/FAD-dependent oxidoreductase [Candidatus Latescibacteria bacterium]|jgi:flavin-dependent dehydrogenase|nr:NAD(P)/FAD-dependent oxidoreductase [Candidatus Latescibacterota bacterium]